MSSTGPLVTVIVPAFNRPGMVAETLDSVRQQTYARWEVVVVDDGSATETLEVVAEKQQLDPTIRLVVRDRLPKGASTCRNIGLTAASGEYIVFLDSDDLLAASCLMNRVRIIEQRPDLDFAAFPTWIFHQEPGDSTLLWNGFDDSDDIDRFLRQDMPWHTAGPIWRKASLMKAGLLWDERAKSWQDWEFHIRALASGLKYVKIPKPDSFYRATREGAVSNLPFAPSRVANRARLLPRLAEFLQRHGALTNRRRSLLAAQFYKHAFCSGQRRAIVFGIWNLGRRTKVLGLFEYSAGLLARAFVWLAGRVAGVLEKIAFPELSSIGKGTHLSARTPLLSRNDGTARMIVDKASRDRLS